MQKTANYTLKGFMTNFADCSHRCRGVQASRKVRTAQGIILLNGKGDFAWRKPTASATENYRPCSAAARVRVKM